MKKLIPPAIAARIEAVNRNDADEAEAIVHALVYAIGYAPSSTVHYLMMLQDDSAALARRIAGLTIKNAPGVEDVL